ARVGTWSSRGSPRPAPEPEHLTTCSAPAGLACPTQGRYAPPAAVPGVPRSPLAPNQWILLGQVLAHAVLRMPAQLHMNDTLESTLQVVRRWSDQAFLALFLAAESSAYVRRAQRTLFRAVIRALVWEKRRGGHALFDEIRGAMARLGQLRARPL